MANFKFTCEDKSLMQCDKPRSEFLLPDFKGIKCDHCYAVVSYEKILVEKPKKVKSPNKVAEIEAPKVEQTETVIAIQQESEMKVEDTEKPKTRRKPKEVEDAVEVEENNLTQKALDVIGKMIDNKAQLIDILQFLKEEHGMSSRDAAVFYKNNFTEKLVEESNSEPVIISAPLPETEAKQKEESLVKAPKPSVEVVNIFPITKVNFIDDKTSYHFYLVTKDGVEFQINVQTVAEKYANAKQHPQVFNNAKIELKYTETDPTEIPINPTVVRLIPA